MSTTSQPVSMPEEVSPCPFCGKSDPSAVPWIAVDVEWFADDLKCYRHVCRNCGAAGPVAPGPDAATAAWDRRRGGDVRPYIPQVMVELYRNVHTGEVVVLFTATGRNGQQIGMALTVPVAEFLARALPEIVAAARSGESPLPPVPPS
jgi:hypothetical protein